MICSKRYEPFNKKTMLNEAGVLPSQAGRTWEAFRRANMTDYVITQVILEFRLVFAYDILEDRCTIDVIITKVFPSAVLKWRKTLRIRILFYVTGQKIRYKQKFLPRN